jgi:hypothetical protein
MESSDSEYERVGKIMKASLELNDIDVQRYNLCAELEAAITILKAEDFREQLKVADTRIKQAFERYMYLIKLLTKERNNRELLNKPLPEGIEMVEFKFD